MVFKTANELLDKIALCVIVDYKYLRVLTEIPPLLCLCHSEAKIHSF